MAGIATLCIGRRGCGKTTLSKKMLEKRPVNMPCLIYDINNEYYNYYPYPFEEFDTFLKRISDEKTRNTYILIEEATIFFSTRSRFQEMMNVLVRARHTQNIIHLNFHSFASVPKNIYHLLDYVIVFKTNDMDKDVSERFDNPNILKAFENARSSNFKHFHEVVKLY